MVPYPWGPLTMTWSETAHLVFRASELWLRQHIGEYPDFPKPIDDLFHAGEVRRWCDLRWNAVRPAVAANDSLVDDLLMARIKHGTRKNPAPRRAAA